MKTIIIEGCDRTGKDTVCNFIKSKPGNFIYRHWGKPSGDTLEEQRDFQRKSFFKEFTLRKFLTDDKYFNSTGEDNTLLWNRSHIGECVYGKLYREDQPDWIFNLENLFGMYDSETYLIMLHGDPEFLCHNDDGESYSNDIKNKEIELTLFDDAFNKSSIPNKLKIKINEGKKYRPEVDIRREVHEFIYREPFNE